MKLTKTKLKQMILDEMKSNLSAADQDQLYTDIQLVRELTVDLESLRDERYKIRGQGSTARADKDILGLDPIPGLDDAIQKLERQILAIAKKYNIRHYYDSPGNRDLINLMKKKFRRKKLEESKDRDDYIDAAFKAIEFYEEGFGGEEPTRNSKQALRGLANLISKGIIACIKQGPSYASAQMELINKAKELGIFDEVAESVIDLSKDDVSPEIRLK